MNRFTTVSALAVCNAVNAGLVVASGFNPFLVGCLVFTACMFIAVLVPNDPKTNV